MTFIVGHWESFSRVELSEADFEQLLAALAPRLFPGFHWYEFKPPIASPHGTAHPDAALVAVDRSEWWVVEIELVRHSTREHVEPQLTKLQDGWYDRSVMEYFARHHPDAQLPSWNVLREPRSLLIVDDASLLLAEVGRRTGFRVAQAIPFRSDRNRFVMSFTGWDPPSARPRSGTRVTLMSDAPVARFALRQPVTIPSQVKVGPRLVRAYTERDGSAFVLAISRGELLDILGSGSEYLLARGQVFNAEEEHGER